MENDATRDRIALAALELFLTQGVKRTNLAEVAFAAGVTRVTVYRYFGDKRGLVRAVCTRIAGIFQRAARRGPADSIPDLDLRLQRLGRELSELPSGNLLARVEEIGRLYPEVHQEFRAARQAAVDDLFRQALEAAMRDGMLPRRTQPGAAQGDLLGGGHGADRESGVDFIERSFGGDCARR